MIEIGEGEEQVEPGGILGEAAVADIGVAPEAFDDAEGKLDLGAEAGLVPVAVVLPGGERLVAVGLVVDEIDQAGLPAVGLEGSAR